MEFTNEQLLDIWREGGICTNPDDPNSWVDVTLVEEGDWEVEHKCEQSTVVFEFDGKYYRFYLTRWGSYWQGYEYDEPDGFEEVEKATKTVEYWRAK
jgi:hypothetical protein